MNKINDVTDYIDPTPHYSYKELDSFVLQAKINERNRILKVLDDEVNRIVKMTGREYDYYQVQLI